MHRPKGILELWSGWAKPQVDHAASSRVHSASLVQPARIRYWASSADISMVPSEPTLMVRREKVNKDPMRVGQAGEPDIVPGYPSSDGARLACGRIRRCPGPGKAS